MNGIFIGHVPLLDEMKERRNLLHNSVVWEWRLPPVQFSWILHQSVCSSLNCACCKRNNIIRFARAWHPIRFCADDPLLCDSLTSLSKRAYDTAQHLIVSFLVCDLQEIIKLRVVIACVFFYSFHSCELITKTLSAPHWLDLNWKPYPVVLWIAMRKSVGSLYVCVCSRQRFAIQNQRNIQLNNGRKKGCNNFFPLDENECVRLSESVAAL